jgi:CMP-N,N'-diacetyllegionaminic acid synthase
MKQNNIIIIPARGNSKGIKNKNLVNFCGKPLLYWSIKQALNNNFKAKVYVSSDSKKILEFSKKNGALPILRPKNLSFSNSSSESAISHACKKIDYKVDNIIFLQATSPLRLPEDINNAYKKFVKRKYDSLFTVYKPEGFFDIWTEKNNKLVPLTINYKKRLTRQHFKQKHYEQTGSIYIFKKKILDKFNNRIGGKIGIIENKEWQTFELDYIEQKKNMEILFKNHLLKYYK